MSRPGDPYRTGQQLYRRPAPMLVAAATARIVDANRSGPMSFAVAYLPLHRTRVLMATEQTLAFGFRAASIDGDAGAPALAALAGLDLLQARRHAAILAGYQLPGDLGVLRMLAGGTTVRGLAAVQRDWASRHAPARGRAPMFDCLLDLPANPSLDQACQHAGITPGPGHRVPELDQPGGGAAAAALAMERALTIALVCARHLGRYTWTETLRTGQVMAVAAWDCFPQSASGGPAGTLTSNATAGRHGARPAAATGSVP